MATLFGPDKIASISAEYAMQMQKEHYETTWGGSGPKYSGAAVLKLMTGKHQPHTVLDYGAGKGKLGRFIKENIGRDIEWTNYDPGMPDYEAFPDGQFDLVVCTDVLEHIEIDRLDTVIDELAVKTGKRLYLAIANYLTTHAFTSGPYEGQDMHLIVETPDWWEERLKRLNLYQHNFEFSTNIKIVHGKPRTKTRCSFVFERA